MERNSNAVKTEKQQEIVNMFPSPTAFTREGGGGRRVGEVCVWGEGGVNDC